MDAPASEGSRALGHRWRLGSSRGVELGSGLPLLVGLVVAPLPLFWDGFIGLFDAWGRPEFRLKAAVPLLCFVMFLQAMRTLSFRDAEPRVRWPGVALVALGLALAVLGNLALIVHIIFMAMIVYVAGVVVTVFGLRDGLTFWAPLASLFLMLPIPRFAYAEIQAVLEGIVCSLGAAILGGLGVPVYLEGQILQFAGMELRAQDAGAGLVQLLPVLLVFFFVASFHRGAIWRGLMPLVFAVPVLVFLSVVRLVGFGLVLSQSGPDAARFLLAATDGWSFFATAAGALFVLVVLCRRGSPEAKQPFGRMDMEVHELLRQVGRLAGIPRSTALTGASLLTGGVAIAFLLAPSWTSAAIRRDDFSMFPPEIAGWSGSATAIDAQTQVSLMADDYVHVDYLHPDEKAPVNFWVAYYLAQGRGRGAVHSPQVCLPADGWNIVSFSPLDLELAPGQGGVLTVNRAVIRRDGMVSLVYYWFQGRGLRQANEVMARLRYRLDGLLIGRTDGALVRYVTPILPDERESDADRRLQRLLLATAPHLPRFVPD